MALSFNIQLTGSPWEKPSPICAVYHPSETSDHMLKVGDLANLNTSTLVDTCQLLAHRDPTLSKVLMDGLYRFYSLQADTTDTSQAPISDHQSSSEAISSTPYPLTTGALPASGSSKNKVIRIHEAKKNVLKRQQVQQCSLHRFPSLTPTQHEKIAGDLTEGADKHPVHLAKEASPTYLLPIHHLRDIIIALTHYGNSLLGSTKAMSTLDALKVNHQKVTVKRLLDQWVRLAEQVLASQRPTH